MRQNNSGYNSIVFLLVFCTHEVISRSQSVQKKVGRSTTSYKARLERIKASGGFNARSGTRGGVFERSEGMRPQELELMLLQGKELTDEQQQALNEFHANNPDVFTQFNEALFIEGLTQEDKGVVERLTQEGKQEAGKVVEASTVVLEDNPVFIVDSVNQHSLAPSFDKPITDVDIYIDQLAVKIAAIKSVAKAQFYDSALNRIGARVTQELEDAASNSDASESNMQGVVDTAFNEMLNLIKADQVDKEAVSKEIMRIQRRLQSKS